jgi:hypothetical protein
LCNGSNSTPDLRNRFVIGAHSDTASVAYSTVTGSNTQTGGTKDAATVSHTHTATVTDPGHAHTQGGTALNIASGNYAQGGNNTQIPYNSTSTATASTGISVANSTEGSSGTNANLPPYYALAYIMKT